MVVYCDSVILIYFLDHTGTFNVRATNYLTALFAAGDDVACTDLVRLECRVQPIRLGRAAKLADFDASRRADVQSVPITTAVFDRATWSGRLTTSSWAIHFIWRLLRKLAVIAF